MTEHSASFGFGPTPPGAPSVDRATFDPEPDGWFGRRAKARRAKLLATLKPVLDRVLAPDETIRYLAKGYEYDLLEFLLAGWAAYSHNLVALLLTDRRLLLVHLDRHGRPGDIKNQVPLEALRESRRKGRLLRLTFADGKQLQLYGLSGKDRKNLAALLPSCTSATVQGQALQHLCPACLRVVPGPVGTSLVCPDPACGIPFRDPARAVFLSTLVPGLGDLYLRHHFFGSLEFVGSMITLGIGVSLAIAAWQTPDSALFLLVFATMVIAIPRVLDWRVTRHMAAKGLVPLALRPAIGGQAQNLPSFPGWTPLLVVAGILAAASIGWSAGTSYRNELRADELSDRVRAGHPDEAMARFAELQRAGTMDDDRRARLGVTLADAGQLDDFDVVRQTIVGTTIEKHLADRFNQRVQAEQDALDAWNDGIRTLLSGDRAAGWSRLDKALPYFRKVRQPHLPATRDEVCAHLAADALAPGDEDDEPESARGWLDCAGNAPPAELAVVRAAMLSHEQKADEARAQLASIDEAALPPSFRLLALETRAALATTPDQRQAVAQSARSMEGKFAGEWLQARQQALANLDAATP